MTDLPAARQIRRRAAGGPAADCVTLGYDERFLRRKRLVSDGGLAFLVDLAETVSLAEGDHFVLDDGRLIAVAAAAEPLLEVRGDLARLAWHIGNRHTPCELRPDRILIRRDPVLAEMLRGLGARLAEVTGPFAPEGGAYGQGRTLGHEHGTEHGHVHHHVSPHDAGEEDESEAEEGGEPEPIR